MPYIFLTATFSPSMKCRFEDELMRTNPIPIYIRVTMNRINARYSIVKVTKKKSEKKMMKLANEISKDLGNG